MVTPDTCYCDMHFRYDRRPVEGSMSQRGFSLLELLIAMAIMMVIAAIAVPHLRRARITANEAAAVHNLRLLQDAENTYSITYPDRGYSCSLNELGPAPAGEKVSQQAAGLIDEALASGKRNGYSYRLNDCDASSPGGTYTVEAAPQVQNSTGVLFFCANQSGTMHYISIQWSNSCMPRGVPLDEKAVAPSDFPAASASNPTASE